MTNGASPPAAPPSPTPPPQPAPQPQAPPPEQPSQPAPAQPAPGQSVEELKTKVGQQKKEVVGSTILAVATEGATAPEAAGKVAELKQTETALKQAETREREAEEKKETAESKAAEKSDEKKSLTSKILKKMLSSPFFIFILGLFTFLYLRFMGATTIANWVAISVGFYIVIGVIFKEPKKGLIILTLPAITGFLDMMGMLTPANSIFAIGFVTTLTLLTFEKTRVLGEKILDVGVYVFGGILIFWLSAWAQLSLGNAYPHIITTVLTISYFIFVIFKKERPWLKFLSIFINILFLAVFFMAPAVFSAPGTPFYQAIDSQRTAWFDMFTSFGMLGKQVIKGAQTQYYMATGDYETGVEAQSEKPLGVFLENVGITSPLVRLDGSIDVFARLRAESFKTEEKVNIVMNCYVKDHEETTGDIKPRRQFSVEEYESQDIDCMMDAVDAGLGPHEIVLESSFSFTTGSFLRSYFMEQERARTLRRQQIDPLDSFGITDKNPVAIFTGGPLKIGLGVGQQPVMLLEEGESGAEFGPVLGITLDRNWLEGELAEVTKINITVPPGLVIDDVDGRKVCPRPAGSDEQTCILEGETLDKMFTKPVILPKTIRVHTLITDAGVLLADAPLAIRSFKVNVVYKFIIRKNIGVTVTAPPEQKGVRT